MKIKLLVYIVALAALAACASQVYVAPATGPRATLKYRMVSPAQAVALFTYQGNACAERKHIGALQSAPLPYEKLAGKVIDPAKAELTTTIPAGRKYKSRAFIEATNTLSCGVDLVFVPTEGKHYEVEIGYAGDICRASLYRVDQATAQRTPEKLGPLTAGCE